MKFANAHLYRAMDTAVFASLSTIETALSAVPFSPCTPSQSESFGWVPPREENGAFVESVAGQWFAKLMIESKAVPATAIKRKLAERVAQIEKETGRKPGRKESKDLKEDINNELLPMAFPKTVAVGVWINPETGSIVLDTASQTRADLVASALVKGVQGLALQMPHTVMEPSSAMAGWLISQEPPEGFTIDRDCELRATDESKAVVRYANHPLDIAQIREHVQAGKRPVRLAMTFEDRVSFTLTEGGTLRGLTFLEGTVENENKSVDEFDANAAITAGELAELLSKLHDALGGEAQMTIADAPAADAGGVVRSALQRLEESARDMGATISIEHGGKTLATLGEGPDAMLDKARDLIVREQKASISFVQRHLQIGYNRAASLIEALETLGIVSACDSMGVRSVLVTA